MTRDMAARPRRHHRLAAATTALGLLSISLISAAPAAAAPPEGWETIEEPGALETLLVLFLIPLAVSAVITLLVLIPSFRNRQPADPEAAWQEHSEWFGGPRRGPEVATDEQVPVDAGTGGASARW